MVHGVLLFLEYGKGGVRYLVFLVGKMTRLCLEDWLPSIYRERGWKGKLPELRNAAFTLAKGFGHKRMNAATFTLTYVPHDESNRNEFWIDLVGPLLHSMQRDECSEDSA